MAKTCGKGLIDTASHAIVDATILSVLREANSKAKQIRGVKLFGPTKDLTVDPYDLPLVQALKETTVLYEAAKATGDFAAAGALLKTISGTLSAWEGTLSSHLGAALRVSLEKARLEAKDKRPKGGLTEADLLDMVTSQTVPAEASPEEAATVRDEAKTALTRYSDGTEG